MLVNTKPVPGGGGECPVPSYVHFELKTSSRERAPDPTNVAHETERMQTTISVSIFTYCFLPLRSTPLVVVASLIHHIIPIYTKVNFTIVKLNSYTMINDNILR